MGLQRMRAGEVAACLCSAAQPVQGGRSLFLGQLQYRAFASPDFVRHHFPDGLDERALTRAPAIVFGPDDQLQHRFLQSLGVQAPFPYHLCPSSEGFVRFAEAGLGYGLMPEIQARAALEAGRLVDMAPGWSLPVPLYWHYWRHGGELLDALTRTLEQASRRLFTGQGKQ